MNIFESVTPIPNENMSQELSNQISRLTAIVERIEKTTEETKKRVEKVTELDMSINHRDVGLVEEVKKLKAELKTQSAAFASMEKRLDKVEQKFAFMGAAGGAIFTALLWVGKAAWAYFTK